MILSQKQDLIEWFSSSTRSLFYSFPSYRFLPLEDKRDCLGIGITLFKLAKSGLILIISVQLPIPFCIDNSYFFHTLFFVSHIFSTNPVPLHFLLLCVVPVACGFVYYSQNNILLVCLSTYGNYNLRTMFLQLEILRY